MSKQQLTPDEKNISDILREKRKAESVKIKRFKHKMEIIRTSCAIFAVLLNLVILAHIFGFW